MSNDAVKRPLRLLACSGSLEGGGSERQLWQLVSRLDRQRFLPQVYLQSRRGPYLELLPPDVMVHAFDDAYPSPQRFPPGRISWLQASHLRSVVRTERIDVVYDRTYHMSLLTGTALSPRLPRVSVIVSPPSRDLPTSERKFVRLKRRLLARAYAKAAVTVCVSQEVADDAAAYYRLSRQRLRVLCNPVDLQLLCKRAVEPLPPTAHLLRGKGPSELHIALLGRMTVEKGHAWALRVVADAQRLAVDQANGNPPKSPAVTPRKYHLHFIGKGPLEQELRRLAGELGLSQQVHWHGYQTNPYPILAACDLVFIPSLYEGFPNAALEALVLERPLLMTDYGATARNIAGVSDHSNYGARASLVAMHDVRGAVCALADLFEHPEAWMARLSVGRRWVEQEHGIEAWLMQMMELLEGVSHRRSA